MQLKPEIRVRYHGQPQPHWQSPDVSRFHTYCSGPLSSVAFAIARGAMPRQTSNGPVTERVLINGVRTTTIYNGQ